jgi:hypothetical protein
MKLPGEAWLVWDVRPAPKGSMLTQSAYFRPRGLLGRAYWYALVPFHGPIFARMLRRIGEAASDHAATNARS